MLSRRTLRSMHRPWIFNTLIDNYKLLNGNVLVLATGYGLRWARDLQSKEYIMHSGGLPGFGCNWMMLPEYGIAIVAMSNLRYNTFYDLNLQIL